MDERIVLAHLLHNEKYGRAVLPFLKPEYFDDPAEKTAYEMIAAFVEKYNTFPTREALVIELSNRVMAPSIAESCESIITDLEIDQGTELQWLIDQTEEFCQEMALTNALRTGLEVLDKESKVSKGSLPGLLQDALNVSFTMAVGHDYFIDSPKRFEKMHEKHRRLSFDIDILNKITKGGFIPKTLNCFMATTGVGKTLVMCHTAAHDLMMGRNVLYITLEMAEDVGISQRVDQNLLGLTTDELMDMKYGQYEKRLAKVRETTKGKLIVKEYPPASVGVNHFRHLLGELRIKKKFAPDIIYVDYINLMISSRLRRSGNVGSYEMVKAIAEELRGLMVEYDLPGVTATQANRAAQGSMDVGLENTSESMGLPMTLDFMAALMADERVPDQIIFKQLKNRYNDMSYYNKFSVGIDRPKMRLFNVLNAHKEDEEDTPIMDNTDTMKDEKTSNLKFMQQRFKGWQ